MHEIKCAFTCLCVYISPLPLQKLTGDSTITAAVTLAALKNPKPVAGEAHVRTLRWYLQGSIEQEVAIEIVKLLKDMMKVH